MNINEGQRKFWVTIAVVLGCTIVATALIIVQPPGVDLPTWLTILSGGGAGSSVLFKLLNMGEHMLKANPPAIPSVTNVMNKVGLLLLVAVPLLLLTNCTSSSPYLPLLGSTLQTSQLAAVAAQAQAVEASSLPGCYASGALSAALGTAGSALASWSGEGPDRGEIPGVTVDITPCQKLTPEGWRPLLREEAAAKVQRYVGDLAPTAFAVTRAILGSSGLECRDVVIVGAVLSYLEGALGPVVEELVAPDGVVEVEAVAVMLDGCG